VTDAQGDDRLRELVQAGIALNSELSLDALLQKLVEAAAALTGARYAAMGVIDESGEGLERIVTTGQKVDSLVEITTGLKNGERVATENVNQLVDGVKVK